MLKMELSDTRKRGRPQKRFIKSAGRHAVDSKDKVRRRQAVTVVTP